MNVVIAGGGIGGLCAGIALQQQNLSVHVYEAAPELRPLGAGIMVPPNAMSVLARLGLADAVLQAGLPLHRAEIRDRTAGVLQTVPMDAIAAKLGHPTVAIRRADLQRILASALQPGTLHLGKQVTRFDDSGGQVRAFFADGSDAAGSLLIGADGIRSAVRQQLFPDVPLRYSGQTCFRGLTPFELPASLQQTAWEVWDGKARFGFAQVAKGQVYWFAPLKAPAGTPFDRTQLGAQLQATYRSFPSPIPELLAAVDPADVLQTDLYDLTPTRHWYRGRVVLLGDAAHATTPNLGQGGAQAVEDALSLTLKLKAFGPSEQALEAYAQARVRRVTGIVKRSWHLGRAAHWEHPFLKRLRNLALRAVPAGAQQRQMEDLLTARL